MKQVVQNYKEGSLGVEEVPVPALKPGCLLVQTYHSLISAGTEKTKISDASKSLVGMAKARPDKVKQVMGTLSQLGPVATYQKVMNQLDSFTPIGYSLAGRVIDVGAGVNGFRPGDMVACGGAGVANHAEVNCIPVNLCVKIPRRADGEFVPTDEASFTTVGAIAMQGVRQADVSVGEVVAVIGLGLVGQLTVMILLAAGCKVLGIDLDSAKTKLAAAIGAETAVIGEDDVEQINRGISNGFGADAVIITTATTSNDPIELAAKLARDRAVVVDVGVTRMDLPREPYYMKELDLRMSRSYGPGRYDPNYEDKGHDYPIGYVRWTQNRNMQSFLDLIASGRIDVRPLITSRHEFQDAADGYRHLEGAGAGQQIGIVLEYDLAKFAAAESVSDLPVSERKTPGTAARRSAKVTLGVIGAGNFARTMLLPHLRSSAKVDLRGIATSTGISAKDTARKFGFGYSTTDHSTILEDEDVNSVLIATRHDSHASLVTDALEAGKHVFVEKPLALNQEELDRVTAAWERTGGSQQLMVGYNRRFSSLSVAARKTFQNRTGPLAMQFRVNAGFIDRSAWVQDPLVGGGRIIGEACHFFDLMQYFTDAAPVSVFAQSVSSGDQLVVEEDNVHVTVKFDDGSIGTLAYLANGDPKYPKEHLEVFCDGKVAAIDNFSSLVTMSGGKRRKMRKASDKGHKAEMQALVAAFSDGAESPISFESMRATSVLTFRVLESLTSNQVVAL